MDQPTARPPTSVRRDESSLTRWARGLETTKVGPLTVVIFIAILGVFSALAAGIGFLTHHLPGRAHPASQGDTGLRNPTPR